jgi:hypothetical protein
MEHSVTRRRAGWAGAGLLLLGILLSIVVFNGSTTARAETGQKALILASSVSGGAASIEAQEAAAAGFGPIDVVDDATWSTMSAAQFADYQLVVVGDPTCNVLPQAVTTNATNLADAVMARAGGNTRVGNRVLIGTDPVFHTNFTKPEAKHLITSGINFAGVRDGATNLYLDFTCNDPDYDGNGQPDGLDTLLPKLTVDPTPGWTENAGPPCGGSVSLISNADQFSILHSSDIQGWFCSVHESFPTFPSDWIPLAVATDTPTAPTCGTDVDTGQPACGEAYVLIAGSGITASAPNLALDPKEATNPVGTTHTVTATVTNSDHQPQSGVPVTFVVTGANAGATGTCVPADCTTDANGHVTFTYTGANAGDDTIVASIDVDGSRQTATAAKTWEAARLPNVSVDDASVTEGNTGYSPATPMSFHVTLNTASTMPADVELKTTDGTATSPADYQGGLVKVHFDPGETSKTVVVNVNGDLIDEPDEQFTVDLQNPVGAVIDDGHGVGTIRDDDRNGTFSCRAAALKIGTLEGFVANGADDPCKDEDNGVLNARLTGSGSVLTAQAVKTTTDSTPDNPAVTPVKPTDGATAHAETLGLTLTSGVNVVKVSVLKADAAVSCTTGTPKLSSSGNVALISVNGRPVGDTGAPVTVPLVLATLRLNEVTTTSNRITRRALVLDNLFLPDIVVSEATADFHGNPCASADPRR